MLRPDNLYLMDGIEGLRQLEPGSVDMLLSDFPYGTTQNDWDVPLNLPDFWEAAKIAVKPNGAILLFAQCPYDKVLGASNLKMLRYEWIWCKNKSTGFLNARRAPLKNSENILVFYQNAPVYHPQFEYREPYSKTFANSGVSSNYGAFHRSGVIKNDGSRFPCNVIQFPVVMRGIHPTQKPVALCEYLIKTYTNEGDLITDICAGSGTTAAACINTNRRYICFENSPRFCTLAWKRLQKVYESNFTISGQLSPK